MKHTTGPYHCKEHTSSEGYPEIPIQAGSEVIATVHDLGRDREEEYEANARLFVAAPALLKALKDAHNIATQAAEILGARKGFESAAEHFSDRAAAYLDIIKKTTGGT